MLSVNNCLHTFSSENINLIEYLYDPIDGARIFSINEETTRIFSINEDNDTSHKVHL